MRLVCCVTRGSGPAESCAILATTPCAHRCADSRTTDVTLSRLFEIAAGDQRGSAHPSVETDRHGARQVRRRTWVRVSMPCLETPCLSEER